VDPIAALVSLTEGDGDRRSPWPADVTAATADKFYQGMNLVQAWRVVPRNAIVGVVDTVRNRLLNFVLDIEQQYPEAGEATGGGAQPSADRVNQIFHTTIMGGTNVAIGSSGFSQVGHQVVVAGNVASLRAHLAQLGVGKETWTSWRAPSRQTPSRLLGGSVRGWPVGSGR
jgi:hypothetical protein